MPTYALLGATGSTGAAILRHLLSQPPKDLTLNVFMRSKAKLLKLFPEVESTTSCKLSITEGTPSDSAALQQCLRGADAIFMCIATNLGKPGNTLVFDTATAIVTALKALQKEQGGKYTTPTILQLRSAEQNEGVTKKNPWLANQIPWFALYYIYTDVDKGYEQYVEAHKSDPGLLEYISVDPPALHDPDGTTPTGYELALDSIKNTVLSYADLGVAFVEIAERKKEFAFKGVCVYSTGHVNTTWSRNLSDIGSNIWARFFG